MGACLALRLRRYLRFEVTSTRLRMEAVSSQDGALMDHFELLRT